MAPETTAARPGIQHLTCESVSSFVKRISSIRARWTGARRTLFDPWFRGHQDARWPLVPGLYRFGLGDEETDLRLEFRRRALQLIPGRMPADDWQWYFLMQHHGAPTRLLDWTDSALVALFFAVSSNTAGNPAVASNAAVWMLDPWALNGAVLGDSRVYDTAWPKAGPYLPLLPNADLVPALPIAIDPPHFTARVAVQRSHCTVFGSQADGLSAVARRHTRMLAKDHDPAAGDSADSLGSRYVRDSGYVGVPGSGRAEPRVASVLYRAAVGPASDDTTRRASPPLR